jgi:alpha-mannosidase
LKIKNMKQYISILPFFLCSLATQAQTVKRLYIANDDHTDYMWTANEAQYDTAFVKMLDYYLHQIDLTKNNPSDFQARFNCDGSYWLTVYEKYRSSTQFNQLMAAIKSGHISSPLTVLASTYGAQPTEAVIRGMYAAGHLERRFGVRFPLAVSMENQTLPLGLSALWAGSGAKYSWKGTCACATQTARQNWRIRRHQLYRYTGLDGSSVLMKWYNMTLNNYSLGGYAETRLSEKVANVSLNLTKTVDTLTHLYHPKTYPYHVAAAFGYGWDDLQTYVSPEFVAVAQNCTHETRKVRVSNEIDFFEDIEKSYPQLPSEVVSYGNEWDLYCTSMNEITARVRRSTEKLRTAEALSALVSLKNKTFAHPLIPARNLAWNAFGLYWEHDWTADGPVKQEQRADWQIKIQKQIAHYTDTLYSLAVSELGKQIKKAKNPRFYVFNPLNWQRNDFADIVYEGEYPVNVIDLDTKQVVANQLVVKNGKRHLRIQADNIPSVGYKIFEIKQGTPKVFPNAATVSEGYISNAFYKIKLTPSGVISELFDLKNKRQLVLNGTFLNDLGIKNSNEGDPLSIENIGAVSMTLKAVSKEPILHTVRLTLFANSPRIEIEDSIQANFSDVKTWSFTFNLNKPTTRHEELGAILTAKKENRGGHYATQNARYDWQTFNHFADMSEANYGITVSNQDCSFFKLGKSTPDSLWETSSQLNALAGGQTDRLTDSTALGIYRQYGQKQFHYQFALTTHNKAFDATEAMKFSLEHQNPLVANWIEGNADADNFNTFSLLSVNDPSVLLWSVKPSEEGIENGLITRFWNFKATPISPIIRFNTPLSKAWQTSHIETNERPLSPVKNTVKVDFKQHQLNTYRLILK